MPDAAQTSYETRRSPRRVFDTVVIGAGPAGTQCALYLGQSGADVLLAGGEQPAARLVAMPRAPGWATSGSSDEVSLRIATENVANLASSRVNVAYAFVRSVAREEGMFTLEMADQQRYRARTVVFATGHADGDPLGGIDAAGLDLDMAEDGRIDVDDKGGTSHSGIYAVGDAASGCMKNVSCAMGTGSRTARELLRKLRAG